MPIAVSYPGVYVQGSQLPYPDSGVATSRTAFIGRAPRGPVNTPVPLNSWADYERRFGGLDQDSSISYQVRAFFENGGTEAVGVRLFEPLATGGDGCAVIALGSLMLVAASPGGWGDRLSATVDVEGITAAAAESVGVSDPGVLFNLTVTLTDPDGGVRTERHDRLTLDPAHPERRLDRVLSEQSDLVRYRSGDRAEAGTRGQGAGGQDCAPLSLITLLGDETARTGLYALEQTPAFNILCIPPDLMDEDTAPVIYQAAAEYCGCRNAMLIMDPPVHWQDLGVAGRVSEIDPAWDLASAFHDRTRTSKIGRDTAVYFPRVLAPDPLRNNEVRVFPNSGYVAGVWARTDTEVGVWKAPAGLAATLNGAVGPAMTLTDAENEILIPMGINALRTFPLAGTVIWGARTVAGAAPPVIDAQEAAAKGIEPTGPNPPEDDFKYIPVRRLALYMTSWMGQNTQWAVFELNDAALWAKLREQISTWLNGLWKQGALFGASAGDAYFVHCDATTTTLEDIEAGVVNVQIGFAPVRPAEFLMLTFKVAAAQG